MDATASRSRRITRLALWVILAVSAALVVGATLAGIAWAVDTTTAIRETQKTTVEINREVLSCTDPEGECARRSARQTGQALRTINEVSTIAAACADKPGKQTVAEVERCVLDEILTRRASDRP